MSSCFQILSSDIRKFHYEHQIHRTNMNEHWLNCLYTRVKPALNKNLTCHLLFDIFQTFSNNWIFLEKFYKREHPPRSCTMLYNTVILAFWMNDHETLKTDDLPSEIRFTILQLEGPGILACTTYDLLWWRSRNQVGKITKISLTILKIQFRSENFNSEKESSKK